MVRGLDRFREHFTGFADRYLLIGGVACDLIMREAGLSFRATKDFDIVLCVEKIDPEFGKTFWNFIKAGGYRTRETAAGARRFYRFQKPTDGAYPVMLELFSRAPDTFAVAEGRRLTSIPINDEISSLSAILLDADYDQWIRAGRREIQGVPTVGPECLVPLKAKAWLDLSLRKEAGAEIDGFSIRKHKNDIFRLAQVIDPDIEMEPPRRIVDDMRSFLAQVVKEETDLKSLGLGSLSLDVVLSEIRKLYRIDLQER